MAPVLILSLFLGMFLGVEGKFKSLYCTVYDKDFAEFHICKLNPINQYRNSMDILYRQKKAADDVVVRMETFRKHKRWVPFIYNTTIKLCDILENNRHFLFSRLYSILKPFLTITNACPWKINGTISCKNFELNLDGFQNRFPLEKGEYAARFTLLYQNIPRISINTSVNYSNYKDVWKKN